MSEACCPGYGVVGKCCVATLTERRDNAEALPWPKCPKCGTSMGEHLVRDGAPCPGEAPTAVPWESFEEQCGMLARAVNERDALRDDLERLKAQANGCCWTEEKDASPSPPPKASAACRSQPCPYIAERCPNHSPDQQLADSIELTDAELYREAARIGGRLPRTGESPCSECCMVGQHKLQCSQRPDPQPVLTASVLEEAESLRASNDAAQTIVRELVDGLSMATETTGSAFDVWAAATLLTRARRWLDESERLRIIGEATIEGSDDLPKPGDKLPPR